MSPVLAQRLAAQHLTSPAKRVVDAARRLLALQGQDLAAVKWALGVRTAGATEADVDAAFDAGLLVRAWPLRGTLHVVPADELAWLQALTAERNLARARGRHRELGLDERDVQRARRAAEDALAGKHAHTREEFMALLERAKVSTAGQRGYHLIWTLSQLGVVCWGPLRDGEQCLVLQREWLPQTGLPTREEALARLAARYFDGHGPATLEDLAWWTGLPKSDFAGLAVPQPPAVRARSRTLLLPGFDEYFLGYADRTACCDERHLTRVCPGGNGVFQPMLVVDGRVVGTWKRELRKKELRVTLEPFDGALPDVSDALTALERYFGRAVSTAPSRRGRGG